ncbi:cob(I)yrinic acid a,c-diamide adenosyltransferase [Endozoicomonas sp. GU-1]|uniref:cob(I)yrinic acid a,c-diamide adenosyltransferase n=1 Tax=Endozoicomonas sp. GU-1 TaxID=3009078 RepID=UPI0022B46660|nr:cob(I)yrinic acid a,c-diamide adenosyltransferase [Endozoicomonas sp. GU-1]WBA81379.1 cob(I)yrinic acid a,c-diamide adenosyltransferase [Endozoicomonas sp. GU-1]WBA84328.1 cob(I)yrinic acid a,c-diamide adenosyltransferase [Endozoicomonas sp. GU-1]
MSEHHRLSRIYTRTGDKGTTGLGDQRRVSKTHERIEAIGAVDELNTWMGLLISELKEVQLMRHRLQKPLENIQHRLFDLGGELAMPGYQLIQASFVADLEKTLDEFNDNLPALENFILPGGSRLTCYCHMVRTISRRAERRVIAAQEAGEAINPPLMQYLNRLSDLMFVLARVVARQSGGEVLWQQSEKQKIEQ